MAGFSGSVESTAEDLRVLGFITSVGSLNVDAAAMKGLSGQGVVFTVTGGRGHCPSFVKKSSAVARSFSSSSRA